MYMKVFPNGFNTVGAHGSHVSVWVPLMKSDHDDWHIYSSYRVTLKKWSYMANAITVVFTYSMSVCANSLANDCLWFFHDVSWFVYQF